MVDTRDRRFSMIGLADATAGLMALPDGMISAPDRAQLLSLYVGIPLQSAAANPYQRFTGYVDQDTNYEGVVS